MEECCRRNFADSLKDSAKRVLENPKLVPRKVRRERLDICYGKDGTPPCDHYLPDTDQCGICQCILGIKTSFANMRCPLDKWTEYPSSTSENKQDGN